MTTKRQLRAENQRLRADVSELHGVLQRRLSWQKHALESADRKLAAQEALVAVLRRENNLLRARWDSLMELAPDPVTP